MIYSFFMNAAKRTERLAAPSVIYFFTIIFTGCIPLCFNWLFVENNFKARWSIKAIKIYLQEFQIVLLLGILFMFHHHIFNGFNIKT